MSVRIFYFKKIVYLFNLQYFHSLCFNFSGKNLYGCKFQECGSTFNNRDEFVKHIEEQHAPKTDFKISGIIYMIINNILYLIYL